MSMTLGPRHLTGPSSVPRAARAAAIPGRILVLALMGGLIALLVVIGYAYSAISLIGVRRFIPMALNSAIGFAVLSIGILHARPRRGLMAAVTSRGAGGAMARRLLPAAIVIPAAVGWVGWLLVQQGGAADPVMGLSLFV